MEGRQTDALLHSSPLLSGLNTIWRQDGDFVLKRLGHTCIPLHSSNGCTELRSGDASLHAMPQYMPGRVVIRCDQNSRPISGAALWQRSERAGRLYLT
ncbi:hypothetical protein AGIG_G4829 [Arapaima gigas]